MNKLKWGILATGGISRQFAGGLKVSRTGELVRVGSRAPETGTTFCAEYGGSPGSYDDVLADPAVEAVYIGLPHHMHSEWTVKCAQAGKAILCEKPFTLNEPEAEWALAEVKKAGVFFMEAFMYRCHPQTLLVQKLLKEGKIGEPLMVNAEFGFKGPDNWTNFRAVNALGGGAVMDVGVYPISFSRMVFQAEPERVEYTAVIGQKGYDEIGTGTMIFSGGRTAHFGTAVHLALRNQAIVHGTEGSLVVESPWKARPGQKILLYKPFEETPFETHDLGDTNDALYGHEADAVHDYLSAGECPFMTIADTLGNMDTLDRLRASAKLHFEGEFTTAPA
jgi:predicted dehydrogenase